MPADTPLVRKVMPSSDTSPHFELHDVPGDRQALSELAEWCQQFSPLVGLDQTDEPDSLLLDVSGVIPLFGGEASLARRVVAACRHSGWDVRVAIADTAGAAWAVARLSPRCRTFTERMRTLNLRNRRKTTLAFAVLPSPRPLPEYRGEGVMFGCPAGSPMVHLVPREAARC